MRESGQMFIELIVGIAIVMLTLVGVVSLSTQSTKTSRIGGNRSEATTYAERYLEKIRRDRDSDPAYFFSHLPSGSCIAGSVPAVYTCTVSSIGSPLVKVTVTLSFVDGSNTFHVTEQTILTNN